MRPCVPLSCCRVWPWKITIIRVFFHGRSKERRVNDYPPFSAEIIIPQISVGRKFAQGRPFAKLITKKVGFEILFSCFLFNSFQYYFESLGLGCFSNAKTRGLQRPMPNHRPPKKKALESNLRGHFLWGL